MKSKIANSVRVDRFDDFTEEYTNLNANANANVKRKNSEQTTMKVSTLSSTTCCESTICRTMMYHGEIVFSRLLLFIFLFERKLA